MSNTTVSTFDTLASEVGACANELDRHVSFLGKKLCDMSDAALIAVVKYANEGEQKLFLLRGAASLEITRRAKRLAGGRGNVDTQQEGIEARRAEVARETGVSPTTLRTDERIVETFYTDPQTGQVNLPEETTLPRSIHKTALAQGDNAQAALQMAQTKRLAEKDYFDEDFAADCASLFRDNREPTEEERAAQEAVTWARFGLSQRAKDNLDHYARARRLTWSEAANAILEDLK